MEIFAQILADKPLPIQFIALVLGFAALVFGADKFVDGAAGIAKKFGVPELIIGFTIVAMGTSAPEAAVSISAAAKGTADVAVGNVAGSNIMNVLLILGITAVISAIPIKKNTQRIELPFLILVSILLPLLGWVSMNTGFGGNADGNGAGYSKIDGVIFLVIFAGYLAYLIISAKKSMAAGEPVELEMEDHKKPLPVWLMIIFVVAGIVLIVAGSNVAVESATNIALYFNVSERIIGLTIVALGTSLPELVTSIMAARKGKADLAIGDIVGSNIFNILFVLGMTALVTPAVNSPVAFSRDFLFDCFAGIGSAVVLLGCVLPKKKLTRIGGIIMLVCYAGYFAWVMIH